MTKGKSQVLGALWVLSAPRIAVCLQGYRVQLWCLGGANQESTALPSLSNGIDLTAGL